MTAALLESKRIFLRPLEENDLEILFKWRNDLDFLSSCSVRRNKAFDLQEFISELKRDFSKDRHLQMMILRRRDLHPTGTIYSYNFNGVDKHCFVTTFVDGRYRQSGHGAEAFCVFVSFLFKKFGLFKIYAEIYEYNRESLRIFEHAGFSKEGEFKKHRLYQGKRFDLIRYSIFRNDLNRIEIFLKRLCKS